MAHDGDALAERRVRVAIEARGRGHREELLSRVAHRVREPGGEQQLDRIAPFRAHGRAVDVHLVGRVEKDCATEAEMKERGGLSSGAGTLW